ncbi:hypothetical protein CCUS01_06250 [Colletotrichum cuscutae]|uniref:Transcription factor domain-containing protein n=1 Tax=Colletotrichum cuscutae TaxID=1209917 RepID=A0AAI9Y0G5_9PEZI|nr:hypothetical protein CCUS01_06250 [Colletotrichum cuscutae]
MCLTVDEQKTDSEADRSLVENAAQPNIKNRSQGPTASTEALSAQVWTPSLLGLDPANPESTFIPEASTFDHQVQWDAFSQIVELPDEVAFGHFPLAEPGLGHITEDLMVGDTDLSPSPEPYRQILPHSMNFGRRVISNTSGIVFPLQFIKEPKPAANGSANMIKQALRSYPEMMLRRSTFPPFIHQYQDKSHLPEPLANCMGIAILFVSRNPDTTSFLWQSIRKEQDRNLSEVGIMVRYSKRDIFASIQAELIYIIMRVVAGGGSTLVDRDYNTHMLLAYEALWKQFMALTDTPCSVKSKGSKSWEDWILDESRIRRRARIACVWFLVAQVATVKVGISCGVLDTWRELTLPCHKVQWGAATPESWDEETKALRSLPKRGQDLAYFGELLESHQHANDAVHAETLDRWNSGVDNIGLLLNLVTAMM